MRVFLRFVGLAALGALAGCTDESPTAPRGNWEFATGGFGASTGVWTHCCVRAWN